MNKKTKFSFSEGLSIGTIGLHLVSGIIVGTFVGYVLDKYFQTSPWLTIIFFFLGIITGFYNMYKDAKRYIDKEEKNSQNNQINNQ
ncbi:MAG: AtpZ/AtpI family protein [Aquificae bacterium]|nr:AtpZ/AtpI family protein [Aquificota bacterium]